MFAQKFVATILFLGVVAFDVHAQAAPDNALPRVVREQEHAGQVVFIGARSPGGTVVTVDYGGGVFLWDPHSLRQISTHRRAPFPVKTAALLDRNTLLVFGSTPRDLVAAIDLNGDRVHVAGQLGGEIASVSAALSNKTVRAVIGDAQSIQVLEVGAAGVVRSLFKYGTANSSAAAISSDGKFVAVATAEKRLTLLDADTGREVWSRPTQESITSLSLNAAAGALLAGYDNVAAFKLKRVDQLSLETGTTVRLLPLHPCSVFQVDILDGARGVASCGPAAMDFLVNMEKAIVPTIVTWSLSGREAPVVTPLPQATTSPLPFRTGIGWDASTRTLVAAYARGQLAALKIGKNDQTVSVERLAAAPEISQKLMLGAATRQIASIAETSVQAGQPGQRTLLPQTARMTIRTSLPAGTFSDEELESGIHDRLPGAPGSLRNSMSLWHADAAAGMVHVESGLGLIVDVTTAGSAASPDVTMVEALSLVTSPPLESTVLAVTRLAAADPAKPAARRLLSVDGSTGMLREGIRRAENGPDNVSRGVCLTAQQPGMVRLSKDARVLVVACLVLQKADADGPGFLAPDYDVLTYWLDGAQRPPPSRVRVKGTPSSIELSGDGKLAAIVTGTQSLSRGSGGSELSSSYALTIVDLVNGKAVKTFPELPEPAMGQPLAVSADGKQVFAALGGRAFRYSTAGQILEPVNFQARDALHGSVSALALNDTGTLLAVSRHGGTTEVYRLVDWTEIARVSHPGNTMSQVGFDANVAGRLVGTPMNGGIALFNYLAGEKVGNFFSSASGAWIAMTPEGTFSGTIGAEIGITVTDGRSAVSVDQLYDAFFRPDLLQRRLRGEHGAFPSPDTIRRALASPPPAVESKLDAVLEHRARLHVALRDSGGGVGGLRVFHNGKLARDMSLEELRRAASPGAASVRRAGSDGAQNLSFNLSLEVPIGAGTNDYTVTALNGERSAQSRFAKLTVERPALAAGTRKAHVLAIGNNEFSDSAFKELKLAERSASGLGATLVDLMSDLVGRDHVVYVELVGVNSRYKNVQDALRRLENTAQADDIVAIVVVTHGKLLASGELHAILRNTRPDGNGALSGSQLVAAVTAIPALNQMLVLDICHAGAISAKVAEKYQERFAIFAGRAGIHVLTSTSAAELALAEYDGMTVFSHFLNEGLKPVSTRQREARSLKTIAASVKKAVTEVNERLFQKQVPFTYSFGNDLLLP